jgi:hypothetical protein
MSAEELVTASGGATPGRYEVGIEHSADLRGWLSEANQIAKWNDLQLVGTGTNRDFISKNGAPAGNASWEAGKARFRLY